jgi:hypothetical protein
MTKLFLGVPVLAVVSLACAQGEPVALNERLFALQSMESLGGGCSLFNLGSGEKSGGTFVGPEFTVSERVEDAEVLIDVKRGTELLANRRYGESFFRSGALDEFVVPSTMGNDLRLRYWGVFHPNGTADCAPLDAEGPR